MASTSRWSPLTRLFDVARMYAMWIPRRNVLSCNDAPHAAEAATLRVRARLAEIGRSEQPVEIQFSIRDQWAQRLFVVLCRRYGLRPYRRPGQKRSTIMVRLPRAFSGQILRPEFVQLNEVLRAHLHDITLKPTRDHVHADTGEAEEVAEKG